MINSYLINDFCFTIFIPSNIQNNFDLNKLEQHTPLLYTALFDIYFDDKVYTELTKYSI